jgi:hypothetical protein
MWASVSVGDTNKGNTNNVVQTNEYVSLPFPCSNSTDCTYYSVTLEPGTYDLEVWGSQGGNDTVYPTTVFGGRGGYSKGTVQLRSKATLYVYVGGTGTGSLAESYYGSTGGGGGTDIRLQNGAWNDMMGLKTRIIVAGGGGGRIGRNFENAQGFLGNDGGGTTAPTFVTSYSTTTGATQTSGGTSTYSNAQAVIPGSFGFGNPNNYDNKNSKGGYNGGARGSDIWNNGGAGGGWWGGCTSFPTGSGGSGFVYTSSNSQCSASSDYYLSNASTLSGNTEFVSPYGGKEIGHRGNGFARITVLYTAPTPSASKNFFSICRRYYSYNIFIPLMSLFVFSLAKGGISFNLLPSFKLE